MKKTIFHKIVRYQGYIYNIVVVCATAQLLHVHNALVYCAVGVVRFSLHSAGISEASYHHGDTTLLRFPVRNKLVGLCLCQNAKHNFLARLGGLRFAL